MDSGPGSGVGIPSNTKSTTRLVTESKYTLIVASAKEPYRTLSEGLGTSDKTRRLVTSINTAYR
jgi:hypothetical protein